MVRNHSPFARDGGYDGPPFRWDEERRFLLRCELDAAFFHLYLPAETNGDWKTARKEDGCPHDETPEQLAELKKHFPTPRDAAAYIMETFPIVKRKDEAAHGAYHTRDTILAIYDEMAEAMKTGHPYQTRLDPPPGPPCDANGNFIPWLCGTPRSGLRTSIGPKIRRAVANQCNELQNPRWQPLLGHPSSAVVAQRDSFHEQGLAIHVEAVWP